MTANGSGPRLASAASSGADRSDDEADLARMAAETRRLNAEADLLMAMDRKRMAEDALRGRRGVLVDFLMGLALAVGLIVPTAAVVLALS